MEHNIIGYCCPHCDNPIDISTLILPYLERGIDIINALIVCPECSGLLKVSYDIEPIVEEKSEKLDSFFEQIIPKKERMISN